MLKIPTLKEMYRHMWGVSFADPPHMPVSFLAVAFFSSLLEADAARQDPGAEGGEALEVSQGREGCRVGGLTASRGVRQGDNDHPLLVVARGAADQVRVRPRGEAG